MPNPSFIRNYWEYLPNKYFKVIIDLYLIWIWVHDFSIKYESNNTHQLKCMIWYWLVFDCASYTQIWIKFQSSFEIAWFEFDCNLNENFALKYKSNNSHPLKLNDVKLTCIWLTFKWTNWAFLWGKRNICFWAILCYFMHKFSIFDMLDLNLYLN